METKRVCGIDVGGTKCLGVLMDASPPPRVLAKRQVETVATSLDGFVRQIDRLVSALAPGVPVDAVGLGVAGLVDVRGALRRGPHLPGLVDVELRELFERHWGTPVVVRNDAECAAVAEHRLGSARDVDDVLVVTLGTGIGGGIVAGGRAYLGANGFAGEVGHQVVDPQGPPCSCGRKGCWEVLASGSSLDVLARRAASEGRIPSVVSLAGGEVSRVDGRVLTDAALSGDPHATQIVEEFAERVAVGLGNLVNILDPELVVIGGGVARLGSLLADAVSRRLPSEALGGGFRCPKVVTAALGPDAGAIGAALLAVDTSTGVGGQEVPKVGEAQ